MGNILSDADLDTIFRTARSYNRWQDKAVSPVQLQAIYDLMRWGPTSANCSPARLVFVTSVQAKEQLADCVSAGNRIKVETAPVTALIGMDMKFYDQIPKLFPHNPGARDWFAHDDAVAEETAFRNATLQGAYLMIAARAVGLDCGPMSGFDKAAVDAAFFSGTSVKVNFICAIGHGSQEELFDRSPRFAFDEACRII